MAMLLPHCNPKFGNKAGYSARVTENYGLTSLSSESLSELIQRYMITLMNSPNANRHMKMRCAFGIAQAYNRMATDP